MRQHQRNLLCILTMGLAIFSCSCFQPACVATLTPSQTEEDSIMNLPEPRYDSDISIEQSLLQRRSIRSYTDEPLTLQELSQLLWAAQGITDSRGFRTAPSAGALYPLELYVVVGDVAELPIGVYRYQPDKHQLHKTMDGDKRTELAEVAIWQDFIAEGAAVIVFTAVYQRTTRKYDDRGIRYVHIEVGHAAQNLCLQATAMDLGTVPIGAFYDEEVAKLLNLPENEQPLYIIPVGKR